MKISLLFGIFPDSQYDCIINNSIGVIQYAADALQKSIIEGFIQNDTEFSLVNLPYIGSYPKRYKKLCSDGYSFSLTDNGKHILCSNVSFNNLTGFKLYSRFLNAKKGLINHFLQVPSDEVKVIVIYAVHTPFLKACIEVKNKIQNVKIVLIVPDLPEYMGHESNFLLDKLHSYNQSLLNKYYSQVDGFVLLSSYMADRLKVEKRPWTVVEGIYNKIDDPALEEWNKKERYILYTGTLARRYGILNLVQAFMATKDSQVKLFICGAGDSEEEIRKLAAIDNRIVYKGQVKREQALELQRHATLLVNPRTPEGEFTKFSFPSKTMEYLASGVPTLLYQLPGIPSEYYEYCYSLKDLSIEAFTTAIDSILSKSDSELKMMGQRARDFILREKNPQKQVAKVVDLINKVVVS